MINKDITVIDKENKNNSVIINEVPKENKDVKNIEIEIKEISDDNNNNNNQNSVTAEVTENSSLIELDNSNNSDNNNKNIIKDISNILVGEKDEEDNTLEGDEVFTLRKINKRDSNDINLSNKSNSEDDLNKERSKRDQITHTDSPLVIQGGNDNNPVDVESKSENEEKNEDNNTENQPIEKKKIIQPILVINKEYSKKERGTVVFADANDNDNDDDNNDNSNRKKFRENTKFPEKKEKKRKHRKVDSNNNNNNDYNLHKPTKSNSGNATPFSKDLSIFKPKKTNSGPASFPLTAPTSPTSPTLRRKGSQLKSANNNVISRVENPLYNPMLSSLKIQLNTLKSEAQLHPNNPSVLDLSNRELSSIPLIVCKQNYLTVLNLYSNQLKSIPAEIGNYIC